MTKSYYSELSLVSYPFTNSEISKKVPRDFTKKSLQEAKIYMLAQARYPRIRFDEKSNLMFLDVTLDDGVRESHGQLNIGEVLEENHPELLTVGRHISLKFRVLSDPDCYLAIYLYDKNKEKFSSKPLIEITGWQILFYRSKAASFISGFDNYREFFRFDVHYIGRTFNNVYERLARGHHARSDILSSERVADLKSTLGEELLVLPFFIQLPKINPLEMSDEQVVDLSEKLLIKVFQPKYNQRKYDNISERLFFNYKVGFLDDVVLSTKDCTFLSVEERFIIDGGKIYLENRRQGDRCLPKKCDI